jgi:hypothetical protein
MYACHKQQICQTRFLFTFKRSINKSVCSLEFPKKVIYLLSNPPTMKKAKRTLTLGVTLVFVSALIGVSACKKTPAAAATCTDGIKNQHETGIDCGGECFSYSATVAGAGNSGWAAISAGNPSTGFVLLSAAADGGNTGVLLQVYNVTAPGTYTINTSPSTGNFMDCDLGPSATQVSYRTDATHTGTITFTKVDRVNKGLSGTFSFTALQYNATTGTTGGTATATVTSGSFTDVCW